MSKLRITEIFYSLQGETNTVGIPTIFIRLTGCPLRCVYCDTAYAFKGGEWMRLESIFQKIKTYQSRYVTVTGGEPLAQSACLKLLTELCNAHYIVSLETSGAIDIAPVDPRVIKILDIKTPASGEMHRNVLKNLDYLTQKDQIKFVICNRDDFEWSCAFLKKYDLTHYGEILFSPEHEKQSPTALADWILEAQLPVRMQIQLHKFLWGNLPGK